MNLWAFILIVEHRRDDLQRLASKHLASGSPTRTTRARSSAIDRGRETELEREVEELRERVKVLERIATEDRETQLLSDEIESCATSNSKKEPDHVDPGPDDRRQRPCSAWSCSPPPSSRAGRAGSRSRTASCTRHRPLREIEGGASEGAARIEIADLKERIRKLEAIASGVDL